MRGLIEMSIAPTARRGRALGALLLAVGALAAPRVASAQGAPPPPSAETKVYRACYVPTTGTVYRIGETGMGVACARSTHVEFSWNADGPQGPPGEKGAPGETGPQGDAGAVGP